MNDFNDWKARAAQLRLRRIDELVDKTRIAVDRTARAYGRL